MECEVDDDPVTIAREGEGRRQPQSQPASAEHGAALAHVALVASTGVVECGTALHAKRQHAAYDTNSPDQLIVPRVCAAYRHIVFDLSDSIGVQKACDKNVRVGPVELLAPNRMTPPRDA